MKSAYIDVTLSEDTRVQCWVHLDIIVVKINDTDPIIATRSKLAEARIEEVAHMLLLVARGVGHNDSSEVRS